MGLSHGFVTRHIQEWTKKLEAPKNLPYRKWWPARLFRHEPVENAAKILIAGKLLSRAGADGLHDIDVAAPLVLSTNDSARQEVRLYFRPKNPTQFSIEGIKKSDEYFNNNLRTHAPILVIFVFEAQSILTLPGVNFSDGNMQDSNSKKGNTEDFFCSIPFEDVYHDSWFDKNNKIRIKRARCAEVLVPSPMLVEDKLKAVMCRSSAERTTLLHMLGANAYKWENKIRVYDKAGLFESKWAYVRSVDADSSGITINFHPREDGKPIDVGLEIRSSKNAKIWRVEPLLHDASKRLKVECDLETGKYFAKITVDSCLAYQATFLIDDLPF
jgi:ssDNA thymidine ADP-ribosyltransferase, DarT